MIPTLNKLFFLLLAALLFATIAMTGFAQESAPGDDFDLDDFDPEAGIKVELNDPDAVDLTKNQKEFEQTDADIRLEKIKAKMNKIRKENPDLSEEEIKKLAEQELSREEEEAEKNKKTSPSLLVYLTILVLSIFVGFEIITKVPPTLHTPLMSGSNAISGITLIGAIISGAGANTHPILTMSLCFLAVVFATVNVVGGFLVTHRMLGMFRKKG